MALTRHPAELVTNPLLHAELKAGISFLPMDIRPITPALVNDYMALFNNAFSDNPRWAGCYCAFYDDPRSVEEWNASRSDFASRNRENRRNTISKGKAYGLLAYESHGPIGWVNAGPRGRYGNLHAFSQAVDTPEDPVGSVMCFVVGPEHRERGIATALLAAVDDYFRELDLSIAEAYPLRDAPADPTLGWSATYFKGSPEMYYKAGYLPHKEFEDFVAVRKAL